MFLLNWLWQIEICKLYFVWRYLCIPEIMAFEFHPPVFKKITKDGLKSLQQKIQHPFSIFCQFLCFFQNTKLKYFSPQIIEFKNQDDSGVFNNDFSGLRNHCSCIDLSGLCNLIGLNSLIFSKNILILMIWSSMASNWPVLLIFLWNGSSQICTFTDIGQRFGRWLLWPV